MTATTINQTRNAMPRPERAAVPPRGTPHPGGAPRRPPRCAALAAAALAVVLLTACDTIFEVENPNNILGEDLSLPQAQTALVNGAFGTVARAMAASLGLYSPATDEVTFIGSRDNWRQLDQGFVDDAQNEFLNVAFPVIAQGRWMADEAIRNLERFRQEGTLRTESDLARAYLYGAIAYMLIGDTFDDFVLSDRRQSAPPLGRDQITSVYDKAIEYLGKGLEIANRTGNRDLQLQLLALRSRAHHARAVRALLAPLAQPADPLVASAPAAADAQAFLALGPPSDWRYVIRLSTNDMIPGGEITLGHNMNNRAELQFGSGIISRNPNDAAQITGIVLRDPVDDVPDPFVAAAVQEFKGANIYTSHTLASTREVQLILAEQALAGGNTGEAVQRMNAVRTLDQLTAYDSGAHAVTPVQLLQHLRRSSLFLQNRRLADMYRFGTRAPEWTPNSAAVTRPGTFLPIANVERQANCHILGTC